MARTQSDFRFAPITNKTSKTKNRYGGGIKVLGLGRGYERMLPGFQFPYIRPMGTSVKPNPEQAGGPTPEAPYIIHGVLVKSVNEWYTYKALRQLGVPDYAITYQYPWHGGRVFGGQVLDFVVDIGGAPMAIRVMGQHWHPTAFGKPLDAYTRAQLEADGYVVTDIPDTQLQSIDDAVHTLSRLRVM